MKRKYFDCYELREAPDDLPRVFQTERQARTAAMRMPVQMLCYGVVEYGPNAGERFLWAS